MTEDAVSGSIQSWLVVVFSSLAPVSWGQSPSNTDVSSVHFRPAVHHRISSDPRSIAATDVNGDGNLDLIVGAIDSAFHVLLGNGDGTFRPEVRCSVPGPFWSFLAAGDLISDGSGDVLVGSRIPGNALLGIYLSTGESTFSQAFTARSPTVAPQPLPLFGRFRPVIGHFNRDGVPDVILQDFSSGDVALLFGNGDGTFQTPVSIVAGPEPCAFVGGDFYGDGALDLVLTGNDNTLKLLVGMGDGTFQTMTSFNTVARALELVAMDFDHDGLIDLASVHQQQSQVSVLLNGGNGTFKPGLPFAIGHVPMSINTGDLNGDGTSDIVTASWQSSDLTILLGAGNGRLLDPQSLPVSQITADLVVADFSKDGLSDLAYLEHKNEGVSVLINQRNHRPAKAAIASENTSKEKAKGDQISQLSNFAQGAGANTNSTDFQYGPQYQITSWTRAEGLPSNEIRCLTQTRDGYLWIGTPAALVRFDGFRFEYFEALSCRSLAEDSSGTLWIGTASGLFKLRNGELEHVDLGNSGPTVGTDIVVCPRRPEGIWAAFNDKVASVTERGSEITSTIPVAHSDAPAIVNCLLEDSSGALWAAAAGKLWHCAAPSQGLQFEQPDPPAVGNGIFSLLQDSQGQLWYGSGGLPFGIRLFRWSPAGVDPLFPESGDAMGVITCLTEDFRGTIWAGSNLGLWQLENGRLGRLRSALPNHSVSALLGDREGGLWVGTHHGLHYLKKNSVFVLNQGLANLDVRTILEGSDGSMWFGTAGGVTHLKSGQLHSFTRDRRSFELGSDVACLVESGNGRILAGLQGFVGSWIMHGIKSHLALRELSSFYFNQHGEVPGGAFVVVPLANDPSIEPASVTSLVPWKDGKVYVIRGNDLILVRPNHHFSESAIEAVPGAVRFAYVDRQSNLWASASEVFRRTDGVWARFGPMDGLDAGLHIVAHEDESGAIWLVSERQGVLRFKHGRFSAITSDHGLFSNLTFSLLEDDFGRYWFNSNKGIFWAYKRDLNDVADGKRTSLDCVRYGTEDGLLSLLGNGWSTPNACKTKDGNLWFPTTKGVAIISPKDVVSDQPVPAIIEQVDAGEKIIFRRGTGPSIARGQTPLNNAVKGFGSDHELLVPPALSRTLLVHFNAISPSFPERIRVRFRLLGRDQNWIEIPSQQRSVHLGQVAPGRYSFQLVAATPHGIWNRQPTEFSLYVAPSFYETRLFVVLCTGLAGVAAALLIYRFQLRRRILRLKHEASVARERERIARDLHDDLGGSLTQIAWLSAQSETGPDNGESNHLHSQEISSIARGLVDKISELVWATNSKYDTLASLVAYLRQFAGTYFAAPGLTCRVDFPTDVPGRPVSAEFRRHTFLILKEALQNVAKHSGAGHVDIKLALQEDALRLEIEDDGRGLPEDAARRGRNGLSNMRQRAEAIGGHLKVSTSPGRGARVELNVRLPASSFR